ncbi:hypothetical protein HDA40_001786 [Hamadaea flava]|uniref:Permease prefix domain 1-containing protein n=1 Tax=Hamadaea flava TaxID=1742688 RepID=A0ABV8LMB2_9ACTN|nr:permease prefix domain 1-containing protein [Hamadaea flava]MCP2323279.1 hypothetical protein [Hamadaea flava]
MDPGDLTRLAPTAAYLADLRRALPVRRAIRDALVDEVADGLCCAIETHVRVGVSPPDAATRAVAEFGPPEDIARSVLRQIAVTRSRHAGIGLVLTGPLVGTVWVATLGGPGDALARVGHVLTAAPLMVVVLAVAIPCAITAVSAAGMHAPSWLPAGFSVPVALVALAACAAGDTLLLAYAAAAGLPGAVAIAALVSGLRLTAVAVAAVRLTRLRAATN